MLPEVHTSQKYYQEFFLNPYTSSMLIPQFQQKEKMHQLSQNQAAPSAIVSLSALHVFSCGCIKLPTKLKCVETITENLPEKK